MNVRLNFDNKEGKEGSCITPDCEREITHSDKLTSRGVPPEDMRKWEKIGKQSYKFITSLIPFTETTTTI